MKYGIIGNKNNVNIGDDIQTFATSNFLPQIDYFIDREKIDEFKTEDEEPVAVIMNAWYMWRKWHWPPSKYIVPKFVGFHYADHQLAKQPGTPIKYEFLTGIGSDYLKAYQPIGARDKFTMDNLKKEGVDSYVSGCITLTLPKMPILENKGKYICLVDLEKRVTEKIKRDLKGSGIEVKVITHNKKRNIETPWEERKREVIKLLTVYQNALCVVTKRLHCSLPCLAMEVPVCLIKGMKDDIRFNPYYDFLYWITANDFMNGKGTYDFTNPPENKKDYLEVRNGLIKSCEEFIASVEGSDEDVDSFVKTTYTDDEVLRWRHDQMKESMDNWYIVHKDLIKENTRLNREVNKTKNLSSGAVIKREIKKVAKKILKK